MEGNVSLVNKKRKVIAREIHAHIHTDNNNNKNKNNNNSNYNYNNNSNSNSKNTIVFEKSGVQQLDVVTIGSDVV